MSTKEYDDIVSGNHLLINKNVYKSGKNWYCPNSKKDRLFKIPATVLENFGGDLFAFSIDINIYEFEKNEQLFIDYKLCSLMNDKECQSIINTSNDKNEP